VFILNQWISSLILLCIISIWIEIILVTDLRTTERILSSDKMRFLFPLKGENHTIINLSTPTQLIHHITEEQA